MLVSIADEQLVDPQGCSGLGGVAHAHGLDLKLLKQLVHFGAVVEAEEDSDRDSVFCQ